MTVRAYPTCLLLSLALPVGCGGDDAAPAAENGTEAAATTDADGTGESSGTAGESSGGSAEEVSYYEDVRPLLAQHCVSCHTDGSIAPFRLDTYDDVAGLGAAIKVVIEARTMPPYGVRADGSCQDYDEPRWLTDDEIATISAWIDGGMAAGDDTIQAPETPTLPTLEGETELIGIPEYAPGTQADLGFALDDYRCFPIDLGLEEDRYLVGYDVLPDSEELVHHVLGFRVNPEFLNNADALSILEGLDDEPGWPCYGAAGDGILPQGVPVTWAPGQGAVNYPEGVGVRFSPGDLMVVQMHYNLLDDAGGIDASKVRLKWSDEVEKEGFQVLWDPFLFGSFGGGGETLEPGMDSVKYNWNASFRDMFAFDGYDFDSIDVLGILPHMHDHGRKMEIDIERADGMECAADVDRYDYNWQRTYFYDEPLTVRDVDSLHVECDFDTSAETEPLQAGFGTQDEMCLVGFFFTESD